MSDFEIQEFDLDDLLNGVSDNVKKDIKTFEDIVNVDGALNREIYIYDIVPGTGTSSAKSKPSSALLLLSSSVFSSVMLSIVSRGTYVYTD